MQTKRQQQSSHRLSVMSSVKNLGALSPKEKLQEQDEEHLISSRSRGKGKASQKPKGLENIDPELRRRLEEDQAREAEFRLIQERSKKLREELNNSSGTNTSVEELRLNIEAIKSLSKKKDLEQNASSNSGRGSQRGSQKKILRGEANLRESQNFSSGFDLAPPSSGLLDANSSQKLLMSNSEQDDINEQIARVLTPNTNELSSLSEGSDSEGSLQPGQVRRAES